MKQANRESGKVIKTTHELPDWFRDRTYSRKLGPTDWYREIRQRQYFMHSVQFLDDALLVTTIPEDAAALSELGPMMADAWLKKVDPSSPIFHISQHRKPIQKLKVFEAVFLRATAMHDPETRILDQKLSELIARLKVKPNGEEEDVVFDEKSDLAFKDFMEFLHENTTHGIGVREISEHGDSQLFWGTALNGTPVTIDTTFDDQTILESVKSWLATQRQATNEKAKRPFNQNDFDDWTYFKIREVCDLDVWAKLSGVKILDKVIAKALWQDSSADISPIDVLRTTTRKKVSEIFSWEVTVRLYRQLVMQEGENFFEE